MGRKWTFTPVLSRSDFSPVPGEGAAALCGGELIEDLKQVPRCLIGREEADMGDTFLERLAKAGVDSAGVQGDADCFGAGATKFNC